MGDSDRIPAWPLALSVLSGPVPAALIAAFVGTSPVQTDSLLRFWGTLSLFGMGYALVFGVPLALWLLRDPRAAWWRWLGAALVAASLVSLFGIGWTALTNAYYLLGGHWQPLAAIILWVVFPLVLLSAALSRWMLLAWLHRADAR